MPTTDRNAAVFARRAAALAELLADLADRPDLPSMASWRLGIDTSAVFSFASYADLDGHLSSVGGGAAEVRARIAAWANALDGATVTETPSPDIPRTAFIAATGTYQGLSVRVWTCLPRTAHQPATAA
ncbi:hypothetical protein [Allonocardiopsis opalescens]|uniref:Uncharacterized protein n=1 Tax=Allonocardiopsis opalescens TaxID=1144618 RepID=A0A2T0Q9A8_9ACTN|nr:hypothetical protein [Allonocardiopsis opalescens]PRY00427.1 hypothetical protein CLV72_10256 [Allonocardiopsis opalescens]